jgi:hypothetical protein
MVTTNPKSHSKKSKGSKILLIVLSIIFLISVIFAIIIEKKEVVSKTFPKEAFQAEEGELKMYQYVAKKDRVVPVTFFRHLIKHVENPLTFPREKDGTLKFPKNKNAIIIGILTGENFKVIKVDKQVKNPDPRQELTVNLLIAYNIEKVEQLNVLKFKKLKRIGDKKYRYLVIGDFIYIIPKSQSPAPAP